MKNPFQQIDFTADDVSRPAGGSGAQLERYDQRDTSPQGLVNSVKHTLRREAARRLDKQVQCEACQRNPAWRVVPVGEVRDTSDDASFGCICDACFQKYKQGDKRVAMDVKLTRATRNR
jgi:hypothetical protein